MEVGVGVGGHPQDDLHCINGVHLVDVPFLFEVMHEYKAVNTSLELRLSVPDFCLVVLEKNRRESLGRFQT